MFGWAKRKIEIAAIKAATEDLDRYILSLRGADDSDVGIILASATFWRLFLVQSGQAPAGAFGLDEARDLDACDRFQLELNRLIKDSQKINNPSSAVGQMVLLFTVRALGMPEVRILGREMWGELIRGMPYAGGHLSQFYRAAGIPMPREALGEVYFVPNGLEPR